VETSIKDRTTLLERSLTGIDTTRPGALDAAVMYQTALEGLRT
jgi:hypothetical protein